MSDANAAEILKMLPPSPPLPHHLIQVVALISYRTELEV